MNEHDTFKKCECKHTWNGSSSTIPFGIFISSLIGRVRESPKSTKKTSAILPSSLWNIFNILARLKIPSNLARQFSATAALGNCFKFVSVDVNSAIRLLTSDNLEMQTFITDSLSEQWISGVHTQWTRHYVYKLDMGGKNYKAEPCWIVPSLVPPNCRCFHTTTVHIVPMMMRKSWGFQMVNFHYQIQAQYHIYHHHFRLMLSSSDVMLLTHRYLTRTMHRNRYGIAIHQSFCYRQFGYT